MEDRTRTESPLVSVGMPVYNAERYLRESIESILGQTHANLELVISDNASTDSTPEICRSYAERDGRVRYVRQERNLGAHPNFNATFRLSRGSFFRWHASDDIALPNLIERCLDILQESEKEVSVVYPRWGIIDEKGTVVSENDADDKIWRSGLPSVRIADLILDHSHSLLKRSVPVYGLARREDLERTGLLRSYPSSDEVFIVELALRGDLLQTPEILFYRRIHPLNYWTINTSQRSKAVWTDTGYHGGFPMLRTRLAAGHVARILEAPIPFSEKLRSLRVIGSWMRRGEWKAVGSEVGTLLSGWWRRIVRLGRVSEYME